jgi:hypothetical protein
MKNDPIVSFTRVCQKLDELRFMDSIDWGILGKDVFGTSTLKASNRLLLFWLCSIIDQFYGYIMVWTNGERAMLRLIQDCPKSFSDVNLKIVDQRRDRMGNTVGKIAVDGSGFILVRDDYARIKNTFNFLAKYGSPEMSFDERFVRILSKLVAGNQGKNGILKAAYFLDGWLFSNSTISPNPTTSQLHEFREKPRKRLWMFLMFLKRDPCARALFREALIQVYGNNSGIALFNIWTDDSKFKPQELELSGDMWNQRLFKALLTELPIFRNRQPKRTAREIASKFDLSPSIFDVTFELGANKCRSNDCGRCPFGDNGLCHKGKEEFCSVNPWLFPYYKKKDNRIVCRPENCPIAKDLGRNLCSREIDRKIEH